MKKINKIVGVVVLTMSMLMVSCIFPKKWNTAPLKPAIEEMLVMTTIGEVAYSPENPPISVEMDAAAIPLKDNYILALTHCTQLPTEIPFVFFMIPVKVVKPAEFSIVRNGEKIPLRLVGRFEDISLFKSEVDIPPYPIEFAKGFSYEPGTEVLSIGFSLAEVFNVKDGVISNANPDEKFSGIDIKNTFMHSIPINPGDSGTPIVIQDSFGNYKIIGITQSSFTGLAGMSFALKSDYVLQAINVIKIMEKLIPDVPFTY